MFNIDRNILISIKNEFQLLTFLKIEKMCHVMWLFIILKIAKIVY
jgi:hypothetical protein